MDEGVGRHVLAYGEVTGHHHSIAAVGVTLMEPETQDIPGIVERFLTTVSDCPVEHQEHGTTTMEPGKWLIRTQRQYNGEDIRVLD